MTLKAKAKDEPEAEKAPASQAFKDAKARRFAPGEYPLMLYREETVTNAEGKKVQERKHKIVADPLEHKEAAKDGWEK